MPVTDREKTSVDAGALRVLVFEDNPDDAELIANELQRLSPVIITWFKRVPAKVGARSSSSAYFPLETQKGEEPKVGETFAELRREKKSTWWQADFDAAILDVFQGDQPAGEDLARWLESPRFCGPVIQVTWYNHSAASFPFLPCLRRVSKNDADWRSRSIDILAAHFNDHVGGGHSRDPRMPIVGARGRSPEDRECVKRYWQYLAPRTGHRPKRWLSLWIGNSNDGRLVHEFLDQEDLRQSFPGVWKQGIQVARHKNVFVSETQSWPFIVENAPGIRCPHVVWIDCGTECDINEALAPVQVMHERNVVRKPLTVLLTERLAGLTAEVERRFGVLGVIAVERRLLLEEPARWAEETFEHFALVLEATGRAEERQVSDEYQLQLIEKLFHAYLRLLLIARGKRYVMGERAKAIDSIVPWLSAYPVSGEIVNTNFQHLSVEWWKRLYAAGRISKMVLELVGR